MPGFNSQVRNTRSPAVATKASTGEIPRAGNVANGKEEPNAKKRRKDEADHQPLKAERGGKHEILGVSIERVVIGTHLHS